MYSQCSLVSLSLRRSDFDPRPVQVRFVVDKGALRFQSEYISYLYPYLSTNEQYPCYIHLSLTVYNVSN